MSVVDERKGSAVSRDSNPDVQILGLTRERAVVFAVMVLAVVVAPWFLYSIFLLRIYCFILFACAYNLLLGYTGLMSFGHAAFFGTGAYLCAQSAARWGLPFELSVLVGTLSAAALGFVFGIIAIRRQGLYFAMITLALAQMTFFLAVQMPFTGSEDGIQSVPRGTLLGLVDLRSDTATYWVVSVILLLTFLLYNRVVHSPFGQVLRAIRNNAERAKSLGYDVDRYKVIAFTLSAGLSGFAASLKTVITGIATLNDISVTATTDVVLITLVGGIGTIFGPVAGSVIILSLEHFLAAFGPWVPLIEGLVFIVFVLLFREGLVGTLQRWLKIRL